MQQKNIAKVGLVGLGRFGMVHAENIARNVPGVRLQAACSHHRSSLERVREELSVDETFLDYEEMVKRADIDAIVISSVVGEHLKQVKLAFQAGKHVFVEKPMASTVEECRDMLLLRHNYPKLILMVGFMRRYDPSYAYAKQKILNGEIGEPYLVKCVSLDAVRFVDELLRVIPGSGGLFPSLGIHDIDLMAWFLDSKPAYVSAFGGSYGYPQFEKMGDVEAGCAIFKFKNGTLGMLHNGRTAAHGFHIETEIVGTKGSIRIGPIPAKNQAMLYKNDGVVIECNDDYRIRYIQAYRNEIKEFGDCIIEKRHPQITIEDGIDATIASVAAKQALEEGRVIVIDYR
jgi:myo-inositol 2-dehydrogenase/D-chiro-inositol 1-dehydrogenase